MLDGCSGYGAAFGEGGIFLFIPFLVGFRGEWIGEEDSFRACDQGVVTCRGGLYFVCVASGLRLLSEYDNDVFQAFRAGRLHSGSWLGPAGCFVCPGGGYRRFSSFRVVALSGLSGRFVVGFFGLSLCRDAWRGVSCLCRLVVELVLVLSWVVVFFRFLGRN